MQSGSHCGDCDHWGYTGETKPIRRCTRIGSNNTVQPDGVSVLTDADFEPMCNEVWLETPADFGCVLFKPMASPALPSHP